MFASFAPLLVAPLLGSFLRRSEGASPEEDVQTLLTRIRQRTYPETASVLADLWTRTIYATGSGARRRKKLNHILELALQERLLDDSSRQIIADARNHSRSADPPGGRTSRVPSQPEPVRTKLNSKGLATLIIRLLNEWLPVEVSRLLLDASESAAFQNGGIPAPTIAGAIERLLVREHLPRETLEMFLEPGDVISAESVYPADLEILRDVVLWLLRRTWAPTPPVMPAALLCASPDSNLPLDYREAVRNAVRVAPPQCEQIYVPLAPASALEVMKHNPVRIGSLIVTIDGRWWESEHLHCGEQCCIVYRPGGRLRIDYSTGHAELRVPWPERLLHWSGETYLKRDLKIFGRQWHISKWELDADRTWLHLVISHTIPVSDIVPAARAAPWVLAPASVDMAWTMLERSLTSSFLKRSNEPIERLRHRDLIPVGHVLLRLTEAVMDRPRRAGEIESQLKPLRDLERTAYGRVPWRILPRPVQTALLKNGHDPALRELLEEVVDGVPERTQPVGTP